MRMYNQLPGLYQLAYWSSQGQRLPDLLKAAQQPQSNPTPQTRPLATTQTPVPPNPGGRPDITTREGRKALQDQFEAQGGRDFRW